MKNWRNFGILLFLVTLAACAPAGLAGRTDLPLVQTTPSGEVKVTYDKAQISYWSSKWGTSFRVPSHLRIWAREFRREKNPLGEESPFARAQERRSDLVVHIENPYEESHYLWLRFNSSQLSDAEIKEWIAHTIGRFRDARESGMPERRNETNVTIDGIKITKADYVWPGGTFTLTMSFRTDKGSYFFYARSRAYKDMETLLKTIKSVRE